AQTDPPRPVRPHPGGVNGRSVEPLPGGRDRRWIAPRSSSTGEARCCPLVHGGLRRDTGADRAPCRRPARDAAMTDAAATGVMEDYAALLAERDELRARLAAAERPQLQVQRHRVRQVVAGLLVG